MTGATGTTQAPPARPPIDPRIRARRIAVARDEGRRRRRRLVALAALTGVLGATWGLTRSPLLDVDRVVVRGAERSGAAAVTEAAGIGRGEAMVGLDLGRARSAVAALPWVERVDLERSWPGTVVVAVEEREPVAAASAGETGWMLVDGAGRLLGTTEATEAGVVRLDGVAADGPPGATLGAGATDLLRLVTALPPAVRAQVASVGVAPGSGLVARLQPGETAEAEVRFGPPEELPAKVLALAAVLDEAELAGVASIDVRVPAAPVLTRR